MPIFDASNGGGNTGTQIGNVRGRVVSGNALKPKQPNQAWWRRVLTSGPVSTVLDVASRPAYAVGNLMEGRGTDALKAFTPMKFNRVLPGQALAHMGVLPGGKLGKVLQFGADVAFDPTTYVTFGAGGVAKSAATQAARSASERFALDIAKNGARPALSAIASHAAEQALTRGAAPRALSVGVRVPFTRGKEATLLQSEVAFNAVTRPINKLRNTGVGQQVREALVPHGAGNRAVHETYQATRRAGEAEKHQVSQQARQLDKEIQALEEKMGWKRGQAAEKITRHLDDPAAHPLPFALGPVAEKVRGAFDQFNTVEQAAGIEKNTVENYVTHLAATPKDAEKFRQLFGTTPPKPFFTKERSLPNLDAWQAAGLTPETNIARLLEVRGHASVDARAQRGFENAVAKHFGATGDLTPAQKYWHEFPASHLTDTKVAPDVAEAVRRVHAQITPNTTASGLEATKRFVNKTVGSWKALALLSPGYHLRNMQSDLMAAYWAGARNPQSFVQAAKVLHGSGSVTVHGRTLTADDLARVAETLGVIRTGQAGKEIREGVAQWESKRPTIAAPGHGRISRGARAVGQAREDTTRLGLFIERLKAGDSFDEAARKTHDFLFDYGDTSRFVQSARRFWFPFITYPSKAIPMVAKKFARNPGTAANLNKLSVELNTAAGGVDPALLPVGQRSSVALPLPNSVRRAIGAPTDQPLLLNAESYMPFGTLNTLNPAEFQQRILGGMMNPFVKTGAQVVTGHQFYTGRSYPNRVKAPAAVVAANKLGIPVPNYGPKKDIYTGKTVPGYSPKVADLLSLWPQYTQAAGLIPGGGTESSRLTRIRYLGGLPVSPYDRAKQQFFAQKFGGK